jgi:hypothetical protein
MCGGGAPAEQASRIVVYYSSGKRAWHGARSFRGDPSRTGREMVVGFRPRTHALAKWAGWCAFGPLLSFAWRRRDRPGGGGRRRLCGARVAGSRVGCLSARLGGWAKKKKGDCCRREARRSKRASRCRRTTARNVGTVEWRGCREATKTEPGKAGRKRPTPSTPLFPVPCWPRRGTALSPAASAFHAVRPNFLLSQSYCQVPAQSTDSARHRTNRKERHGTVG